MRLANLFGLACLAGAPFAAHASLASQRGTVLAGTLVAAQAGLIGWIFLSLASAPAIRERATLWMAIRLTAAASLFGLTLAIWRRAEEGWIVAAAVPHTIAYLGLLILFAASLLPNREAVITRVARRSRGALNDVLLRYTRRVTIAWCCFFAAQLAASLLLGLLAPPSWWSVFNLCGIPLVLLMFGGELAVRHWRHGIYRPAGVKGRLGRMLWAAGQIRSPLGRAEP
jgi:uncharacterized membrane protein